MRLAVVLLCLFSFSRQLAFGQVTQQFTGTISIGGNSGGPGFFGTPDGTPVTGTFTINTSTLGTPIDSGVGGNEWNQGLPNGIPANNSDSISAMAPNSSISVSNLQSVIIGETYRADLQYGGAPLTPNIYYGGLAILCLNGSPNLPIDLTAFPLVIPPGCTASVDFTYGLNQYFISIDITSLATSLPALPSLLDPSNIATQSASPLELAGNRAFLATGGRPVQGIAADGTAELLLRIPVIAANDNVQVTVLSDQCTNPAQPSTCEASVSTAHDGGLRSLSAADDPSKSNSSAKDDADQNNFAYVIYQAPIDFVRPKAPNDTQAITRTVSFQVNYSSNGKVYGPQFVSLTVIRPPLILLHGYAAGPGTWDYFDQIQNDARVTVSIPNYSGPITVKSTNPPLACILNDCQTTFKKSDLGFSYNTPAVAQDILGDLESFAVGYNPTGSTDSSGVRGKGISVAVSQVDIIAHSMGGLIARYWSTDQPTAEFKTADNYKAGYIHKLLTLGTPHYGTPFASAGLYPEASCFRFASAAPQFNLFTTTFARYVIGTAILMDNTPAIGAVGELSGDGIGDNMNDSLKRIKDSATPVWLATIGGEAHPAEMGIYTAIRGFCLPFHPNDPVASRFIQSQYNDLFDPGLFSSEGGSTLARPNLNDGVVPINSALLGHLCIESTVAAADNCFDGYAHGYGTAALIGALSLDVVDRRPIGHLVDGALQDYIDSVLNTSVENPSVWSKR